jgi:hypothetical protein
VFTTRSYHLGFLGVSREYAKEFLSACALLLPWKSRHFSLMKFRGIALRHLSELDFAKVGAEADDVLSRTRVNDNSFELSKMMRKCSPFRQYVFEVFEECQCIVINFSWRERERDECHAPKSRSCQYFTTPLTLSPQNNKSSQLVSRFLCLSRHHPWRALLRSCDHRGCSLRKLTEYG